MHNQFAKTFDTRLGQVVIMLDRTDEDAPALMQYAQPEGCGVCRMASIFEDSEAGALKAIAAFEQVDQAYADEFAEKFAALLNPE